MTTQQPSRLSRREAIQECKRLWGEIQESGLSKGVFLRHTGKGAKWRAKNYLYDCPLCELAKRTDDPSYLLGCSDCPLAEQYGKKCYALGFSEDLTVPSKEWLAVIDGLREDEG